VGVVEWNKTSVTGLPRRTYS